MLGQAQTHVLQAHCALRKFENSDVTDGVYWSLSLGHFIILAHGEYQYDGEFTRTDYIVDREL